MGEIIIKLFIDRTPQEVFDFITNPENDHLWQKDLISSEWITPEPAVVGSTRRTVSKFLGRELTVTSEFTAWDSPNLYSFKTVDAPFDVSATTTFESKEMGTELTMVGQIKGSGFLRLFEGLVTNIVKKNDTNNFNKIKDILESR